MRMAYTMAGQVRAGDWAVGAGGRRLGDRRTVGRGGRRAVIALFAVGLFAGPTSPATESKSSPLAPTPSAAPGTAAPTVTVAPNPSTTAGAQIITAIVTVSGASGGPTGSVTLTSGGYTSVQAALSFGQATIYIPSGSLAAGVDTIAATYTPDASSSSIYSSASGSATVTVTFPTAISPCQTAPAQNDPAAQTWFGNGPCGGGISALVVDPATPTTIYAGSLGGGVFKSMNGGASWTAINNGLASGSLFNGTTTTTAFS